MQITSEAVQRWIRVALYVLFGGLANHGVNVGGSMRDMIIAGVGLVGTVIWTKYGSTMNAMLTEIGKIDGVKEALVKVDPVKVSPAAVNDGTPNNVQAKPV